MKKPKWVSQSLFFSGEHAYLQPPEQLIDLRIQWIPAEEEIQQLRKIRRAWYQERFSTFLESLNLIQWEVMGARVNAHPFPAIAVALSKQHTVGVLGGYPDRLHNCFYIVELAFHPGYAFTLPTQKQISRHLLEAAIDFSIASGFHGWVACSKEMLHLELAKEFGFCEHDAFTYRKMGYFA